MARYIDADKFIEWLDVGHLRSPSEICYSEGDVKVMIDMQPTAEVAPRADVAREIFEEIDTMMFGTIIPNDCAIISIAKLAELKKKYTEGQK